MLDSKKFEEVLEVVKEVGYNKTPRESVRRKICESRSEGSKYVRAIKNQVRMKKEKQEKDKLKETEGA